MKMKKTIPLPSDVENIYAMIFHLLKMLFPIQIYVFHRYSLHMEHFVDMGIFLEIRHDHEVMFMR